MVMVICHVNNLVGDYGCTYGYALGIIWTGCVCHFIIVITVKCNEYCVIHYFYCKNINVLVIIAHAHKCVITQCELKNCVTRQIR